MPSTVTVFARKWRPKSFGTMVGQHHVTQAMTKALRMNRLHHAYLFTGTRGVGKTTIARIFAKSLNCLTGITDTPCGVCQVCHDIDDGVNPDVMEIDAASRSKVDDIRSILENVPYLPTSTRFKVYLIDEVHMLSIQAFNALLKTLEEPPSHVKFILATTDPQKLPVTVISRCLSFALKKIPENLMADYMASQLELETEVTAEYDALLYLAKMANGSLRDALTLLDQASAYSDRKITENNVISMLQGISPKTILDIVIAILDRDFQRAFTIFGAIKEYDPDYLSITSTILNTLNKMACYQCLSESIPESDYDLPFIKEHSPRYPAPLVQDVYKHCLIAKQDFQYSHDFSQTFTMLLLRVSTMVPASIKVNFASERGPKLPSLKISHWMELDNTIWQSFVGLLPLDPNNKQLVAKFQLLDKSVQGLRLGFLIEIADQISQETYDATVIALSNYFGTQIKVRLEPINA